MRARIVAELSRLECEKEIRVLYACESGSRAWGFESPDSDWDVRFLYVHTRDRYLSIASHRDVIEEMLPGDLDFAGWDLRKALGLLRNSNPSLIEWLSSPLVYAQDEPFMDSFRELASRYVSLGRLFQHYRSMARGNAQAYLQGPTVVRKKYLYVLRPLLACRWIERGLGAPPMEFSRLLKVLPTDVSGAVDELLREKRSGSEMGAGPAVPTLGEFISSEVERLSGVRMETEPMRGSEELDSFFRASLHP